MAAVNLVKCCFAKWQFVLTERIKISYSNIVKICIYSAPVVSPVIIVQMFCSKNKIFFVLLTKTIKNFVINYFLCYSKYELLKKKKDH